MKSYTEEAINGLKQCCFALFFSHCHFGLPYPVAAYGCKIFWHSVLQPCNQRRRWCDPFPAVVFHRHGTVCAGKKVPFQHHYGMQPSFWIHRFSWIAIFQPFIWNELKSSLELFGIFFGLALISERTVFAIWLMKTDCADPCFTARATFGFFPIGTSGHSGLILVELKVRSNIFGFFSSQICCEDFHIVLCCMFFLCFARISSVCYYRYFLILQTNAVYLCIHPWIHCRCAYFVLPGTL